MHQPPARPLVLLVDDEPDILECLQDLIERSLAYRVVAVESGPEALRALAALGGESPDLLVVDHQLRGMSGVDLLEHVRAERAWIPAVLCTAYADAALLHEAVQRGRISVLVPKPIDPEPFLALVQRLVGEHRAGRVAQGQAAHPALHGQGADPASQPG